MQQIRKSVTATISQAGLQPYGGFIPVKEMTVTDLTDGSDDTATADEYATMVKEACDVSNITPSNMGLVVDYMLRAELALMYGFTPMQALKNAFFVGIQGAMLVGKGKEVEKMLKKIAKELEREDRDDYNYNTIVVNASRVVVYDAVVRAGYFDPTAEPPKPSTTDADVINLMIGALLVHFLEKEKGLLELGVGFSAIDSKNISPSDGDYLTEDSLIDLKTSKTKPSTKDTLQLLVYYIMGLHEKPEVYSNIKYLKIINPKLGKIYTYETAKISDETIEHVGREIIGYDEV